MNYSVEAVIKESEKKRGTQSYNLGKNVSSCFYLPYTGHEPLCP